MQPRTVPIAAQSWMSPLPMTPPHPPGVVAGMVVQVAPAAQLLLSSNQSPSPLDGAFIGGRESPLSAKRRCVSDPQKP